MAGVDVIIESGEVIRIEEDGLWVRTIRSSTCQACQARHGCGQKLLNRVQADTADIKARLLESFDRTSVTEGDRVEIGIDQNAVVISSVLLYGLPLLVMMLVLWAFEGVLTDYNLALLSFVALMSTGMIIRGNLVRRLGLDKCQPLVLRKIP